MLRNLIRRMLPSPLVIDDPTFGRLRFQRTHHSERSYWEGAGVFTPTGTNIEYFIDADEEGPGPEQRALYRVMQSRYPELRLTLTPLLVHAYREWCNEAPPPDIWGVFTLASLSVPRAESPAMHWEMTFDCRDDDEHIFTAVMLGWEVEGPIRIDG